MRYSPRRLGSPTGDCGRSESVWGGDPLYVVGHLTYLFDQGQDLLYGCKYLLSEGGSPLSRLACSASKASAESESNTRPIAKNNKMNAKIIAGE